MREAIFTQGDFTLVKESGIGMSNTPWEGLHVISDGAANKHVVEVRLISDYQPFDGKPIKRRYESVYVAHGMRSQSDSFADTEEYIRVLQDALEFAKRVERYIHGNDWAKR